MEGMTEMKKKTYHYYIRMGIAFSAALFLYKLTYAYIDPGTTSVVFSTIAYVLAGAAVVFSFLIAPIRKLYKYLKGRLKNKDSGHSGN